MNGGAADPLAGLAAEAADVDRIAAGGPAPGTGAGAGGAAQGDQAPQKLPTAKQLHGIMSLAIDQAREKYPTICAYWSEEKITAFCEALGPLLDKYNLDAFGFFDQWAVELMAAWICIPMLYQTSKLLALEIERAKAEAAKVVNPAEPAPGAEAPPG